MTSSTNPATIEISYESYRRCLEKSIEADERFPWLNQAGYFLHMATVGDEGVWLKL